jgi:putative transposase
VQLTSPGGLLTGMTKMVLETVMETELSDHLGYDQGDPGREEVAEHAGRLGEAIPGTLGSRTSLERARAMAALAAAIPD